MNNGAHHELLKCNIKNVTVVIKIFNINALDWYFKYHKNTVKINVDRFRLMGAWVALELEETISSVVRHWYIDVAP